MNLGVRAILLIAAVICFIIAIFTDLHWPDWIAIGLALWVGSILARELGWDRSIGTGTAGRTD
jgi:hypothetical protein